jgi:protein-S-isoprenylcysteine O-methyltransferase Ste14
MTTPSDTKRSATQARRALWATSVFYVLIAFEFFYMATPFAAYFYAVYGPGLDWLQDSETINWTIQFFLPHLVEETRSPLLDGHEAAGIVLFLGGLLGFGVGAFQIYRAKLRRDNAVMGGLYRHIRHPQYLALIVASIGMVLIWPRFLVLMGTVTVIFIYIALAKAEEGICLRQFPDYRTYMTKTGMFLPRGWMPHLAMRPGRSRFARIGSWVVAYVLTLVASVLVAQGIRNHTIDSLYALRTEDSIYLSVTEMPEAELAKIARIASEAPEVTAAISAAGEDARFLNYVVPTEMYISEIPMKLIEGETFGHSVPKNRNMSKYKVIFTEADFGGDGLSEGGDILRHAVNKYPLVEIRVDLETGAVENSFPPPEVPFYGNRQVPLF